MRVDCLDEDRIRRAGSSPQTELLTQLVIQITVAQPPVVAAVTVRVGAVVRKPAQILDHGVLGMRADEVFDAAERTVVGKDEFQRVAGTFQHLEHAQSARQERLVIAVIIVPDRQQQRQPKRAARFARGRPARAAHLTEAFEVNVLLLKLRQLGDEIGAHHLGTRERLFHRFHMDHQDIALFAWERELYFVWPGHTVEQLGRLKLTQDEPRCARA